jgi:plasmid maintenance system antidote protein VapI
MAMAMAMTMYNPAHPGEILREYLGTMQVGVAAKKLRVARSTLSFGTEPGMWLDLQQQYDLWHAAQRKRPKVEKFPRAA